MVWKHDPLLRMCVCGASLSFAYSLLESCSACLFTCIVCEFLGNKHRLFETQRTQFLVPQLRCAGVLERVHALARTSKDTEHTINEKRIGRRV